MVRCIKCGGMVTMRDEFYAAENIHSACAVDGLLASMSGTGRVLSAPKLARIFETSEVFTEWQHIRDSGRWKKTLRAGIDLARVREAMSRREILEVKERIARLRGEYPYAWGSDILRVALNGMT